MQFILFIHAFESPLFYNNHNCQGDIIIIPFAMGTHQGDSLGGALFVLAHFRALRSIFNHFLSYLFPSIIDNTQIIGPFSIVSFAYEHFQIELHATGLFNQPHKRVTGSPFGLLFDFNTPS